jgi:diguanylate cyclase (GGDEF)-like protein
LSGETLFAKREGEGLLYTTPIKYHTDSAKGLELDMKQIKTSPMLGALSGESGEGVKLDYRGTSVVAAWRYLPELDWGAVVKIDADEVFVPLFLQRQLLLETLLGLLLFAGLIAYYFGRQISVPLKGLARTADEVAKGNLNMRADESVPGELGRFARAFNNMAGSLQGFHQTLEKRIEERTRELSLANEEIKNLAFYDTLTNLPNRRLLMDRLNHAMATSARSDGYSALLFIDLDNFKNLNDTHGHDMGDMLLQQVTQRLESGIRKGDTVARLGGDEFVVMLEDLSDQPIEAAAQTDTIGEKILAALSEPYQLDKIAHRCTASIGVTLFSGNQQATDELMKQADIAMYQAKKSGRNALRFFDMQMQENISARVSLESELHNALEFQQFHLYYQIQVDSASRPCGAEALIRWIHPVRGLVSPMQFIHLAEETGLILPIGLWLLETACTQLKAWEQDAITSNLVLAINVSAKQFYQADFGAQVKEVVQRHVINPRLLKLELTENLLQENIEDTISTMNKLNEIGIQFSLDDFGTGYSSLQYLKKLPLDQLKIDQSFIRDIASNISDKMIVHAIITMAHGLGFDVIAEGVETEEQRQFLMKNGCTHYQGYLFGKPVPIEQFEALLKQS